MARSVGEYAAPARSASTHDASRAAGTTRVRPPTPRPPMAGGSAARSSTASRVAVLSRASHSIPPRAVLASASTAAASRAPASSGRQRSQ